MTLRELNQVNRDKAFIDIRLRYVKQLLLILTIAASAIVLIWVILDKNYLVDDGKVPPILRQFVLLAYILNLGIAYLRNTRQGYKQHLLAGFYLGNTFYTMLAAFTGASHSPYWFGLIFNLIAWYILVPLTYRALIIHSVMFVVMFIAGMFVQNTYPVAGYEIVNILFVCSGVMFVGIYGAIVRNRNEAQNYISGFEIQEKNEKLETANKELKKFRLVLDQAPGAVYILDKYLNFEYINPFFTQISGYTAEELINKNMYETVYNGSSQAPESRSEVSAALKDGKNWQGELLTINKSGQRYWANTIAAPYKNSVGEVDGYVIIQQDITEKKKMELAMAEQEKLYRSLMEKSLDGVIITQEGKVLKTNKAFADMIGCTVEECITNFGPQSIVPEDRERVVDIHYRRAKGELSDLRYTASLYHKNGSRVTVDFNTTTIEVNGTNASLVTARDITEITRIQKELEKSEIKYKTLVENSQDAIIITQDFKFKFVNNAMCRMLGYTLDEFYSMHGLDVIPENEKEKLLKLHNERMKGRVDPVNYSTQMVTKSGNIVDLDVHSTTVDFDGRSAAFMTLHDVTEKNRMQGVVRESERKYRELTEMLPQTVFELDKDANVIFFNQTGFKQFGIDYSDLGTSALNYISPSQHDVFKSNMKKTLSAGKYSFGNKYTAVRKNGETFPAITFAGPILQGDEVTGVRGIILDMSEYQTMENALRESEEKYRALIDNATDGIVITQNGMIKFCNPAMCEMMQYPLEELLEKPYLDYVLKEDHDVMTNFHKRRMEGQYFTSIYRSRFIPKDGKLITMELNARTSEYNGQPAAFIIIRNITERLKIENELQSAKTELEKLNRDLEKRVLASSKKLTEANTQLIKLQKENLQSQFEVLRQQVNPHFLFNSLNVLTSLIKIEPDLAEKFTEHLSKVYRYVLENKDNELVSLQTELDFLDAYIFLLNIRFMDKIEVQVTISDDKKELLILPLALQLLIENAIKHNSMSKKNPLKIEISIENNNTLKIENNLQERESHMASTGVGLKNIEHRYHLLDMPAPQFIKTETKFAARIPLKE